MTKAQANKEFEDIQRYYRLIKPPKYRNVNLTELKQRYETLINLQPHLNANVLFGRLINAMSQIIARLEKQEALSGMAKGEIWSNLSERGMNKVIPPVYKSKGQCFPIKWTDRWDNTCYVSNGNWAAKNYQVMDALGYMFVLKEGGDCLPKKSAPIFDDLFEIQQRESQLNKPQNPAILNPDKTSITTSTMASGRSHSISFTDKDFRKQTGFKMGTSEILQLLLETSRVEFKLTFPVRLKSTGSKENTHRMNFFSRFYELGYEDIRIRKDGIVQERRYRVHFNTLLGELFVNNLMARYNDRVDLKFYLLPDSAQIFYRRVLLHNNISPFEIGPHKIAGAVGLKDSNTSNLIKTVERNILEPLRLYGYIESFRRAQGLDGLKYVIMREQKNSEALKDAGSVKKGYRVGKK